MSNLFVSYDLMNPGQGYDKVAEAIKSLGSWARVHKSFWYVKSQYSASEAAAIVWKAMDRNDTLVVVDATNNNASWYNVTQEVTDHMQAQWGYRSAYQKAY